MAPVAFFVGQPPKNITTPIPFHPPELVLELGLTKAVDIWNLGCTVSIQSIFRTIAEVSDRYTYELVTGRPLFEAFSARQLIPQFISVIGNDVPPDWISNALRDNKLPNC